MTTTKYNPSKAKKPVKKKKKIHRKKCIHKVTDRKTHKQRRCRSYAVKGSKYCAKHANMLIKSEKKVAVKDKAIKQQIIKLASIGLRIKDLEKFFSMSATIITEKYGLAYKKGRQLWVGTTAGRVEEMASLGMSQEGVAQALNISPGVLVAQYRTEYDRGANGLRLRLRSEQVNVALGSSPSKATMLIFLGKNYLGQRDKFEVVQTYDLDQIDHQLEIASKTNPAVIDQFIAHVEGGGNPMEFLRQIETGRLIEDAEFEEVDDDSQVDG